MAIANITGNILTDSGISTSSLLPLSGGTLTGALSGTSATFSGTIQSTTTSTNPAFVSILPANSNATILQSYSSNSGFGWKLQQDEVSTGDFRIFRRESSVDYQVLNLARSSGAATFSSSVTTGGFVRLPNNVFLQSADTSTGWIEMVKGDASNNTVIANNKGASIVFNNDASTERMRITSGGDVSIGTTTTNTNTKVKIKASSEGTGISLSSSTLSIVRAATDTFLSIGYYSTPDAFVLSTSYGADGAYKPIAFATSDVERMRITSAGVINTTSRLNVNGAGDNSLFSFINNGTTYTLGFSPNATASTSTTLTITTATTTWIYNGTGTATWTLPNPSGTNQMFWIKNAGTGVLTLNAFSGTNIINNSATAVSSITIAVGATALIQQDGNIRSYQLQ
jgi:hypothetical protein